VSPSRALVGYILPLRPKDVTTHASFVSAVNPTFVHCSCVSDEIRTRRVPAQRHNNNTSHSPFPPPRCSAAAGFLLRLLDRCSPPRRPMLIRHAPQVATNALAPAPLHTRRPPRIQSLLKAPPSSLIRRHPRLNACTSVIYSSGQAPLSAASPEQKILLPPQTPPSQKPSVVIPLKTISGHTTQAALLFRQLTGRRRL